MDAAFRTVGLSAAAIIILATGILLARSGYPFNALLLGVHKLVSLAALLVIGLAVYRSAPVSGTDLLLVGVAVFLCITAFASGGVISAFESVPVWVVWSHRVGAWITGLTAALLILKVL